MAIPVRRPILIFWAPVALGPPISGDKINEVERIKVLSRKFMVYGFVLIPFRDVRKSSQYLGDWFGNTNLQIKALPYAATYGLLMISTFACGLVVALNIILRRMIAAKVDLVICRGSHTSLPVIATCKILGVKMLYNAVSVPFAHKEVDFTWHRNLRNRWTRYMMRSLDYFVLRNADHVAVSNEEAAQELQASFGPDYRKKTLLLPFPIPDELFDYAPKFNVGDEIELVYHGSIYGMYDFTHLIQAVHNLNAHGRKVLLTIYASRKNRDMIGRGHAFVHFKNQLPREQIFPIITRATAVVVPKNVGTPGIAIKALEAMALGVPVIIANPREPKIFRDNETCLVAEDTSASWERAIVRASEPARRRKIIQGARQQVGQFRSSRGLNLILGLCGETKY